MPKINEEHSYYPATRFHKKMVEYLDEYTEYLLMVKSDGTSVSHNTVIHEFINYLLNHHLISSIDQITVSIANSKFHAKYKFHNKEKISNETIKKILKEFFTFLYGKHDIKNEKLMRAFERKSKHSLPTRGEIRTLVNSKSFFSKAEYQKFAKHLGEQNYFFMGLLAYEKTFSTLKLPKRLRTESWKNTIIEKFSHDFKNHTTELDSPKRFLDIFCSSLNFVVNLLKFEF